MSEHRTYTFGQSSADGDACRGCSWQGPVGSGERHEAEFAPEPADQTRADAIPTDPEGDRARHDAWLADQTRADVVLTVEERGWFNEWRDRCDADPTLMRHEGYVELFDDVIRHRLAARDAEHAAEVEALERGYNAQVGHARTHYLRAEAAEATVARVRALAEKFDAEPYSAHAFHGFVVAHDLHAALDGER